jgi:hypothetical protein
LAGDSERRKFRFPFDEVGFGERPDDGAESRTRACSSAEGLEVERAKVTSRGSGLGEDAAVVGTRMAATIAER